MMQGSRNPAPSLSCIEMVDYLGVLVLLQGSMLGFATISTLYLDLDLIEYLFRSSATDHS